MKHINEDFVKKFLGQDKLSQKEQEILFRKQRMEEYYSKPKKIISDLNEEAKNNISSSISKIFKNNKKKNSVEKALANGTWVEHMTPYGLFYYNKEQDLWANNFGRTAKSLKELIDFFAITDIPESSTAQQYTVTSSFINTFMSSSVKNLIIPTLSANNIKPGLVLYESTYASAVVSNGGTQNLFNKSAYQSILASDLSLWSTANNSNSYFQQSPPSIMVDFETNITDYIAPYNQTGITMMNMLIDVLDATKQSAPNSTVYHYGTPAIPYYDSSGTRINQFGGSGYTFTQIVQQYTSKVNYFKDHADMIDISTYCPYYENPNYSQNNALDLATYAYQVSLLCKTLNSTVGTTKQKQITVSFVLYPGASVPYPSTVQDVQNLGPLVFTNNFINEKIFIPAKQNGITNMFLWENWYYRTTVATTSNPTSVDTYLQRKTLNDLFADLNSGDTGYALTDNSSWSSAATQTKIYQSLLTKHIQLAQLFKQQI
jgi:hypothetical protein